MKSVLFVLILTLFGCQTTTTADRAEALNKKELRGYFTQNFQNFPWSSKARSRALGGMRAPPPPVKVQILDTRDPKMALADNWKDESRLKSTITPLHWKELMDEEQHALPDVRSRLEDAGLQRYELLLILADTPERAQRLAEITLHAGFSKTKYYNAPYVGIADIFTE
ncbi:hypothetical protein EZJ49_10070 [Bdellovibrio bacteriovorus]|uniref:hypothetical protein n=1 Tax=Bdellovibrio bacteriovorus TaxID=959 RepID=UPI0021D03D53|nr:hypothetical protein [Bdellovibrio bacteriovorus]UXR63421.1 hypothetical protein EZJ49_10070 [Bdellovibrio bacteriovorus]